MRTSSAPFVVRTGNSTGGQWPRRRPYAAALKIQIARCGTGRLPPGRGLRASPPRRREQPDAGKQIDDLGTAGTCCSTRSTSAEQEPVALKKRLNVTAKGG
jgi:hypothetical protein